MSNNNDINNNDNLIIRAITNVLRPMVRFLIARGITFPMLAELLKRLYVEVAAKDYKLNPDKPVTDSRITLLTKVHRKDVRRLREENNNFSIPEGGVEIASKKTSLGAQIVAKWHADKYYTDKKGEPLPLHMLASQSGGLPSFEELVSSINNDIRHRVALDEMLSQNMVIETDEGMITLNKSAFIPKENFEELMGHFDRNLHDHMAAAVHNVEQNEKGNDKFFLERSVYYKELSQASIEKIEKLVEEQGMESLITINKAAYDLAEEDQKTGNTDQRMTFGIYFYADKDDE